MELTHVHDATRVGVVWVPRWKWISGKSTETNYRAVLKALAFADSFMRVEALVALPYDWTPGVNGRWTLQHVDGDDARRGEAEPRAGDPAMEPEGGQTK